MGLRGRSQYLDKNCFFVTTTCYKWYKLLELNSCKDIVINSISFLNSKYKTDVLAYVLMPNHVHLIVYFKELNQLSNWMRDLKKFTAVMIRKEIEKCGLIELVEKLRINNTRGQVFKIWQDRFDDLFLDSAELLEDKLEYIHMNPLQEHWSLVDNPEKYEYSSAGFYDLGRKTPLEVVDYRNYF